VTVHRPAVTLATLRSDGI